MSESIPSIPSRRHDLDALRGIAMLLGIFLHASIAYAPDAGRGWPVQDAQSSSAVSVFIAMIHGFRMPLFFLLSGFFTMMLFRRRGLSKLIEHRMLRIGLPLVLGMCTIIPVMWIVSGYIQAHPSTVAKAVDEKDLFTPILQDDLTAVEAALGADADVNQRSDQGDTPFLVAAFLGRDDIAQTLLDHGADPEQANHKGERPIDVMRAPWDTTQFVAGMLQIELVQKEVETGRQEIASMMGKSLALPTDKTAGGMSEADWKGLMFLLFDFPLTGHLWFLWFLCFLVTGFAIATVAIPTFVRVRWNAVTWTRWPSCLLWLVPLTMLPSYFMEHQGFGPATSVGLIPHPSVLIYYALFFGFGAVYFDANDQAGELGRSWKWTLPISLTLLLGLGWTIRNEMSGWGLLGSLMIQATYAWTVSFGMMGLFRSLFARPSPAMRYLSDSSYWLYLAHLPWVMYLQYWVRDWNVSLLTKFAVVSLVACVSLLISYQVFVRHTPIGWMLNGKRNRKEPNVDNTLGSDSDVVAAQLVSQ
ncbi:acyltransferase family protein [Rhodopirellula sp. JC740]|uniref:Acyltransferase family protein n=1 Tax=Rhodopirellula halodulae TaxID=2894198 RepID=A0ABS8NJ41_9BACT|nr:acyltransferase family protein [Rhodopirellula sp. JC740]